MPYINKLYKSGIGSWITEVMKAERVYLGSSPKRMVAKYGGFQEHDGQSSELILAEIRMTSIDGSNYTIVNVKLDCPLSYEMGLGRQGSPIHYEKSCHIHW